MGITRDQASTLGQVGSGSTVTTTWGTAPTAGSTVLVIVQCVVSITSVTDNGSPSRTFTQDKASPNSTDGFFIFRANNVQPSGTYTVTVTPSAGGHTIQAWGQSYLNVQSGAPTASNSASGTGTSMSTGAAAPSGAGGLVFGGFSDDTSLNPETITFTGSAPQTEQVRNTNGSSFAAMAAADALTGSSQNFTWTIGDSQPWGGCVVAYDSTATPGAATLAGGGALGTGSAVVAPATLTGGGAVSTAATVRPPATLAGAGALAATGGDLVPAADTGTGTDAATVIPILNAADGAVAVDSATVIIILVAGPILPGTSPAQPPSRPTAANASFLLSGASTAVPPADLLDEGGGLLRDESGDVLLDERLSPGGAFARGWAR